MMASLPVPVEQGARYHEVIHMPSALADKVWILVKPFVSKALAFANGEVDENMLLAKVVVGQVQLWVVYEVETRCVKGVATTSILQYDRLQALRIITMAGQDFDKWGEDLHEALLSYAEEHGCSRLEAAGRKGLGVLLARFGFEQKYVTFVKEVK